MKRRIILLAAAVGAVSAGCTLRGANAVPAEDSGASGIVDHHVHILGPDVLRDWKALGVTFSRPDSIYVSAASLLNGRSDSITLAVLVPMGHLYAHPEFVGELRIDTAEVHRRVRRECVGGGRSSATSRSGDRALLRTGLGPLGTGRSRLVP